MSRRGFAIMCIIALAVGMIAFAPKPRIALADNGAQSSTVNIRLISDDPAPCDGAISIYANGVWSGGFEIEAGAYLDTLITVAEGQWVQVWYSPVGGTAFVLYPVYLPTQAYYVTLGGGTYHTGFATSASIAGVPVTCLAYTQTYYTSSGYYSAQYSPSPGGSSQHGRLVLPELYVIGPEQTTHAQNSGLQAHTLYPITSSVVGAGNAYATGALVIPAP